MLNNIIILLLVINLAVLVIYWRKDQNNPSEITEKIKDCLNNKTTS